MKNKPFALPRILPLTASFLILSGTLFVSAAPVRAQETPPEKPAADKASAQMAEKLNTKIRLTDGVSTAVRTRKEMGFRVSPQSKPGNVSFEVDKGALKDALGRIASKFHFDGEPAAPTIVKGAVVIEKGKYQRDLNVPTTAELIARDVAKNPAQVAFNVTLDKKPPVLSADRIKTVDGILGTFSTKTSVDSNRNTNVNIGVKAINGTLLSPGETFSLNETVGKRTEAAGFKTAHVFVDSKIVDGIGGGVSQVTGTLFNAAARAGLQILEVHPHSRPVAYIPVGYDATVAFGAKDLRFKNNTKNPVYIGYYFQNRDLTATIWGTKTPDTKYTLKANVQRKGPGKIDAQLYRTTKQGGKVVNKEKLFGHAYRWNPKGQE